MMRDLQLGLENPIIPVPALSINRRGLSQVELAIRSPVVEQPPPQSIGESMAIRPAGNANIAEDAPNKNAISLRILPDLVSDPSES
jgi:hypothetical protein